MTESGYEAVHVTLNSAWTSARGMLTKMTPQPSTVAEFCDMELKQASSTPEPGLAEADVFWRLVKAGPDPSAKPALERPQVAAVEWPSGEWEAVIGRAGGKAVGERLRKRGR